jgi:hypothetical protein
MYLLKKQEPTVDTVGSKFGGAEGRIIEIYNKNNMLLI